MEKVKKYGKFLIAPIIAVAITLVIYAIKGIYPFGGMTIAHADMGQSYETFYHLLWDILRGEKSILYSFLSKRTKKTIFVSKVCGNICRRRLQCDNSFNYKYNTDSYEVSSY